MPVPLDFSRIKTYSIHSRGSKVNVREHFAGALRPGMRCSEFMAALPKLLGAESLHGVVEALVAA